MSNRSEILARFKSQGKQQVETSNNKAPEQPPFFSRAPTSPQSIQPQSIQPQSQLFQSQLFQSKLFQPVQFQSVQSVQPQIVQLPVQHVERRLSARETTTKRSNLKSVIESLASKNYIPVNVVQTPEFHYVKCIDPVGNFTVVEIASCVNDDGCNVIQTQTKPCELHESVKAKALSIIGQRAKGMCIYKLNDLTVLTNDGVSASYQSDSPLIDGTNSSILFVPLFRLEEFNSQVADLAYIVEEITITTINNAFDEVMSSVKKIPSTISQLASQQEKLETLVEDVLSTLTCDSYGFREIIANDYRFDSLVNQEEITNRNTILQKISMNQQFSTDTSRYAEDIEKINDQIAALVASCNRLHSEIYSRYETILESP